MPEYRRILLDGAAVQATVEGDELVAGDGRRVKTEDAQHLPPVVPSKVIAVHLNHRSRVDEFRIDLPDTPTYFHKPTSSLNSHKGAIVRPAGCKLVNYEGEVAIVIGKTARNIAPAEAGEYIAGYTIANDYGLHDFRDTTPVPCSGSRAPTPSAPSAPAWSPTGTSAARACAPTSTARRCRTVRPTR
ncbi:5-carboxymethyl-2-hydroxymuconate isomerase OS=Streptomyces griseorubiginosus OX=67304 GN=AQJ54_19015 PE=4 SV=1 [Streptomyces griseorubiginosus]